MLDDTAMPAILQRALEVYICIGGVQWYPTCDHRDELVHSPESFQLSEVSLYVNGVYWWCNQ